MGCLHVTLINQRIVHCGVDFLMSEESLHLFDWHPLVDCIRCQGASELVRMDVLYIKRFANLPQPEFDGADRDSAC